MSWLNFLDKPMYHREKTSQPGKPALGPLTREQALAHRREGVAANANGSGPKYVDYAAAIKRACQQSGRPVSQNEIAKAAGVSASSVGTWLKLHADDAGVVVTMEGMRKRYAIPEGKR